MEFLLLRETILIIGTFAAAVSDFKTGLILDKITYPMLALGIVLNLMEIFLGNFYAFYYFVFAGIVFFIGYVLYFLGKLGGGDVKLFTAIVLLLPVLGTAEFPLNIFMVNAIFVSAITSITVFAVYFLTKYARKGIKLEENKKGIIKAVTLGMVFVVYFYSLVAFGFVKPIAIYVLSVPVFFGLVFIALENGIKKNFFLKKVKLNKLEEDEVVAAEFLDEKTKKELGLKLKGVLGVKEIEKLKKGGIREILVYRDLPRFGPFTFIGVVVAVFIPNIIELLFL